MPEARDRLLRQVDVAEAYSQRRRRIYGVRSNVRWGTSLIALFDEEQGIGTEFRWTDAPLTGRFGPVQLESAASTGGGGHGGVGRGNWETPRNGRGRNSHTPRAFGLGRENQSPDTGSSRGRGGRGRASVLPSWYPRTPLRDITAVVRAIERRSTDSGEHEGQQTESLILEDQTVHDPSASTSGAPLEQYNSMASPPNLRFALPCPASVGKVPKILLNILTQNDGNDGYLTPQQKLMNSIDEVERVVMEELRKLKRTPAAKRVEKERRVRTLMSMR